MKKDLRMNEENWVALAACVTLAVSVLIKARRHVSSCSWPAPYRSARPPNWGILLRPARIRVKGLVMAPCAKFPNPLLSCE